MGRAAPRLLIIENGRARGEAIARFAAATGVGVRLARPYLGEALPPARSADAVVLTGGPGSVCDLQQADSRCLPRVLAFTQRLMQGWTPVIGICLGHQLIARALGGKVASLAKRQVGIRTIIPTSTPAWHPSPSVGPLRAFVFHQDHVPHPPPRCTVTFRTASCAVAGFSHTERPVHALQFHPEIASAEAQAILRWWGSEHKLPRGALAETALFDATPAHQLLVRLIEWCAVPNAG